VTKRLIVLITGLSISLGACASKILKADDSDKMLKNEEYEHAVTVKEIPTEAPSGEVSGSFVRLPGPEPVPGAFPGKGATLQEKKAAAKIAKKVKAGSAKGPAAPPASTARQPELEDSDGFNGRRPIKDPFRVGEKVTFEVSYFNVAAGDMTLETRGFATVNGHPSYHFAGTAKSTSVFAMFYAVEDWFETYVDYDTMVPYSYSLHVKETKQLRETRTLFDWTKNVAKYWDSKINEEKQLEKKEYDWEIPAYSQNVFSAVFYLRTFKLEPGRKFKYRVAHEKENFVVTGEVLRREHISTPAGEFDTLVLIPHIELNGNFRPVGDIFFWMTDDDRKLLVKFESKIKIGKIVAVAKAIESGIE
jgi:hypothetical protein